MRNQKMSKSILYRYLSAEAALKTLETRSLRVSRLAELNDPFEWLLGVEDDSPEILKRHDELFQFMNENYGIISFSAVASDPVIWSHYANSHKGVAIEVNHDLDETLLKVDYVNERPTVPKHCARDPENHIEELRPIFSDFFRRKSPSWKYAHEYRVAAELNTCEVGGGMFFKKIPDNFVMRVIIGSRSSVSAKYVRRVLDSNGLNSVQIVKAHLSRKTYDVEIG